MTRPRLRLRGALLVGTLIPLSIVAVVSLFVTAGLTNSLNDADALQRSTRILYRAGLVTKDVVDAETGLRGFVITGQDAFLEPYSTSTTAFPTDSDVLSGILVTDPSQAARLQSATDGFNAWQATIAVPVIAAVRAGNLSGADDLIKQSEGKARMDDIRVQLDALTSTEQAAATARALSVRDFNTNVRRIAFYGALIAIVLGVIIAIVFARRVSRRVRSVAVAAAALAAGNRGERVVVTGHDEIADLGNAFNAMAVKLEAAAVAEGEANEELRRRTAETEAANRELEAFSYSVSHDLRAPLRSIDGFSQALAEDYADRLDTTAEDFIGRVRAASRRMAALIDDLLRLSRITREPMRTEPIDLSAMAGALVADLRAADPDRHVAVTIQPGMAGVGDARLVRIALENLVGNAWKFTAERTDATIDVHEEAGPEGPRYVVSDNGAGFDMRYAANLFGPFQRMHPVERFSGTGIGLATVQRIVHRHGGTIEADSDIGRGARFRFTLGPANNPVASDRAAVNRPPAQPAPGAGLPGTSGASGPASSSGARGLSAPSGPGLDVTLRGSRNVASAVAMAGTTTVTKQGDEPGGR